MTAKKTRISVADPDEATRVIESGFNDLYSATLEELRASIIGLAEKFILQTCECDDEGTLAAVAMQVLMDTLAESRVTIAEATTFKTEAEQILQ